MQWRFIPFSRLDAFENMAIDEAVFRINQCRDVPPTLRLYGWSSPTVSLGYFQNIEKEVDVGTCRRHGVTIVRRPTGGKAVLHDGDLTYAVVATEKNPLFPVDLLGTYRVISQCLAHGLAKIGVKAEMAGDSRISQNDSLASSCFSSPSMYELLVKNRKICGSAQVRSRGVFLQHGSILMDFNPFKTCEVMLPHSDDYEGQVERLKHSVTSINEHIHPPVNVNALCDILKAAFENTLNIQLAPGTLSVEEEELKAHLMKNKYMNHQWNMGGGCKGWISKV